MDKAREIIDKVIYATLATVSESGQPWNSPVFSAYDSESNIYWGSYKDSQHSKNIKANGKVFIVTYDSTAPAGTGAGVYIKATATELSDSNEIALAHKLLEERRRVPYWKLEQIQAGPIRLYKAVPEKMWLNDEGDVDGNYIDILKEVA